MAILVALIAGEMLARITLLPANLASLSPRAPLGQLA
jgi:hypothetical protein